MRICWRIYRLKIQDLKFKINFSRFQFATEIQSNASLQLADSRKSQTCTTSTSSKTLKVTLRKFKINTYYAP